MPNKEKGKQAEEITDRKVPQPNQKTENFLFIKCLGSGAQGSVWVGAKSRFSLVID